MAKRKKKRWIAWVVVLTILAGLGVGGYLWLQNARDRLAAATAATVSMVEVARGDISVMVSATGSIRSALIEDVVSSASGTVLSVGAKEGDAIKAGELLLELGNQDLADDISRSESNLKQQEINLSKQTIATENYKIAAPADGVIKNIKARTGEDLSVTARTFGAAALIVDEAKFYIVLNDIDVEANDEFEEGDRVRVEVDGKTYNAKLTMAEGYMQKKDNVDRWIGRAEVEVPSSEPSWEAKAKVYHNDTLLGTETIEYRSTIAVTGSGKVTDIHVAENQRITRGTLLFSTDDSDVRKSISSQKITVEQNKTDLETKRQQLDDTMAGIAAPIDGIITSLSVRAGEVVSKNRLVATITSTDLLEVGVMIDELDIPKVKMGQTCAVIVDALPGQTFAAKVSYIAAIGTPAGGVTNYEVRAALEDPQGILVGMNATVKIHIDTHAQTLYIPIEAATQLSDGSYTVYLQNPMQPDENGNAPEAVTLTTGLINENNIEVLSGAGEGQTIFYTTGAPTDYFSQMFPMMNRQTRSNP